MIQSHPPQEDSDLRVLDYVPSPVVVLDRQADGAFVYVWINRAATEFSGVSAEDILGKTPVEMFPGRQGRRLLAHQTGAVTTGKPRTYAYSVRLPIGERWIETHLQPVADEDGQVGRLIAFMTDRTEEHTLEQAQAQSDTVIRMLESDMERFVSMAAHDLRTPMRNVSQIAEMLREDFVDHGDGKLELIDMLEGVGVTASCLITDVLEYARASSVEQRLSRVDLAQLCNDIFAVLDPQGLHELTGGQGTFDTDGVALQIVLRNLVENAIKHSGRDRISLQVDCEGGKDGMLEFWVRDNGRGFEDPTIAFLDSGQFRDQSGFGLLGIKRMVTTRKGDIWAERRAEGTGAEVHFTLPGTPAGP